MTTTLIVTPFFLDQPAPVLDRVGGPGATVIRPDLSGDVQAERMRAIHEPLADRVAAVAAAGGRAVSMAGDCLQAAAVLAGLRRAGLDPLVVWLDAHGDFNTPETTPSGFVGGMPLAMLVGRGEAWLRENLALDRLDERDVWLSDGRDLDPGEAVALAASQVTHVRDVARLAGLLPQGRPLYVHFDPDIIDPAEAPAMLYPARGGPSVAELCRTAAALHERHQIAAVSMTAWALERDTDGQTGKACREVLAALTAEP